jgi:hypothetical protein
MEKATGRDLDEWITVLDGVKAQTWNHAEIMAFLRQFGFEFSWRKIVTDAYEKAIGRRSVVLAADRRCETVVDHAHSGFVHWLSSPRQSQFSIWQLMLATFCVACLLGFLRALDWYRPAIEDYIYGIPLTAGMAVIALSSLLACLAIRAVRRKMAIATAVVLGTAVGIRYATTFNFSMLPGFYGAVLAFEVLMMASFVLVRHRGYRLVRVQSREQPNLDRSTFPID